MILITLVPIAVMGLLVLNVFDRTSPRMVRAEEITESIKIH